MHRRITLAAYYNEWEPAAAQWLRNLIAEGHIAPGDVDERSITDVHADDLRGYTQAHFFAGIGGWSYALRRAGWSDDRPVWTASCPCQPFSDSGARAGFDDPRHLWPHLRNLIAERRPPVIFGEQVASKIAEHWLDLVQLEMEQVAYAFGAIAFPAASVGAPHIRDRVYWVGHTDHPRSQGHPGHDRLAVWQGADRPAPKASLSGRVGDSDEHGRVAPPIFQFHDKEPDAEPRIVISGLADSDGELDYRARSDGTIWWVEHPDGLALGGLPHSYSKHEESAGDDAWIAELVGSGEAGGVADSYVPESQQPAREGSGSDEAQGSGPCSELDGRGQLRGLEPTGAVNGFWANADWLFCRDGKWRPVESGTFPLAHGASSRVVRLRAYGNCINVVQAQVFIESYRDAEEEAQAASAGVDDIEDLI